MKRLLLLPAMGALIGAPLQAQVSIESHRAAADRLIQAALHDSAAYRRLAVLTDRFGSRMSGSKNLEDAIDWIAGEMRRDGLENVHTEPVDVTHWVRGKESAALISPRAAELHVLGLGRSVGTSAHGITAKVLVVRDFAELRTRSGAARGRIVVYNHPFDTTVHPFVGYGAAVQYRAYGVDSAAQFGAVAVLVRSVTPHSLGTPHTGALSYADTVRTVPKILAAAITVEDAGMLQRMQDRGETPVARLVMGARTLPDAHSRNIIAEIRGSELPDEIVVVGGHIDSWDVGQGAMDDGGGSVAAWEAVRLIRESGVRPRRTIRVVLWTNEEIGLAGATGYRDAHWAELRDHVLAMESDNGVFRPVGLNFSGTDSGLAVVRQIAKLLRSIGADSVSATGPEADVWPLNEKGIPALSVATDPSRYFWYHHSEADTIDKLDPREMGLCVAAMAVAINTVANLTERVPRNSARKMSVAGE